MIKKEYRIVGLDSNIDLFIQSLRSENIRFGYTVKLGLEDNYTDFYTIISLNISPDMVSEVEELIMEIAEKSGVKVE